MFITPLLYLNLFFHSADKVVVVSYNILGVENASNHPDLYSKVPTKLLDWNRRRKLINKEINQYNPSILCFQASVRMFYKHLMCEFFVLRKTRG